MTRSLEIYNDTLTAVHDYNPLEDAIYGDLFQWGRIADGHQSRTSPFIPYNNGMNANVIGNGKRCATDELTTLPTGNFLPMNQIKPDSTRWYGNFITNNNGNWTPVAQAAADQLWRSGTVYEDPCTRFRPVDSGYQDSWHTGEDGKSAGIDACINPGGGWRTPSQAEWSDIYRGGSYTGSPAVATANSWKFISLNVPKDRPGYNKYMLAGGYQIQPDNVTTTLFLPASGRRHTNDGTLSYPGIAAQYWSSTAIASSANSYNLYFTGSSILPNFSSARTYGFALRCIKNT
jgi:uncharacterized protein (TIGR02145 family)